MSKEQYMDKMTYAKVSCGNIERIKLISKKGETFDNVLTKILDYYEDLRREDLVNTRNNGNQYKKQIKDKRWFYSRFSSL
jgi:hypothetical protein